jgi:nitrogen fixation protein FixH
MQNANNNAKISVQKTADGLSLEFPDNFDFQKVHGTVSLYRPSNKQLDFDFPISLSNAHLLIPDKRLLGGRWDIKVSWQYGSERYMHKERLIY